MRAHGYFIGRILFGSVVDAPFMIPMHAIVPVGETIARALTKILASNRMEFYPFGDLALGLYSHERGVSFPQGFLYLYIYALQDSHASPTISMFGLVGSSKVSIFCDSGAVFNSTRSEGGICE